MSAGNNFAVGDLSCGTAGTVLPRLHHPPKTTANIDGMICSTAELNLGTDIPDLVLHRARRRGRGTDLLASTMCVPLAITPDRGMPVGARMAREIAAYDSSRRPSESPRAAEAGVPLTIEPGTGVIRWLRWSRNDRPGVAW